MLLGFSHYHLASGIGNFAPYLSRPGPLHVRIGMPSVGEPLAPAATSGPAAKDALPADLSAPVTSRYDSLPSQQAPKEPRSSSPFPLEQYYRSADLDVRPQIKVRVMPTYPEIAVLQNIKGKVIINVFINEGGEVDKVVAVRAEPPGIFEDSATTAFRTALFTPGLKGHKAVKSLVILEVNYDSAETEGALTETR